MLEAMIWGMIAASSLLIGAMITLRWQLSKMTIGLIAAFGVGVLISGIVIELVERAIGLGDFHHILAFGLLSGSLVFFGLTYLLGKAQSRRQVRQTEDSSPLNVFAGTALDGIPESLVLGLSLIGGGTISIGMLVAIFLSNLPEAMTATDDLKKAKWKTKKIINLWLGVVIVSGLASLVGFMVFDSLPKSAVAFTLSFSAGALITMIADAMMPEAYKGSKNLAGIATTIGFGVAFIVDKLM